MSLANSRLVTLSYGAQGRFCCEIDERRVVAAAPAPPPLTDLADELRAALARPLDFPCLEQAVIPDDHIVLALDAHTPQAATLVAGAWGALHRRRVAPERVTVLQPAPAPGAPLPDPRSGLPEPIRHRMDWKVHRPDGDTGCAYLAATAAGERVYLAREAVDADVVVSIGPICYDPLVGCRGTNSVFFPGLSSSEAIERAHGQGHHELGPDESRPLRQVVDEIGWLLGTQFSIQVIPSAGEGVAHVLAGAADSVLRRGRELLAESWLVELDARADTVIAAVDTDAGGHGWEQIGAAVSAARNLVSRGGRIVLLSELDVEPGQGLEMVRQSESPRDAIRPLRKSVPADLLSATQLAGAADWADVYLLSRLQSDLVEDLFLLPLETEREVERLLEGSETCVFLSSAQHVFGRIRGG